MCSPRAQAQEMATPPRAPEPDAAQARRALLERAAEYRRELDMQVRAALPVLLCKGRLRY
jgi:hypothetical protein